MPLTIGVPLSKNLLARCLSSSSLYYVYLNCRFDGKHICICIVLHKKAASARPSFFSFRLALSHANGRALASCQWTGRIYSIVFGLTTSELEPS